MTRKASHLVPLSRCSHQLLSLRQHDSQTHEFRLLLCFLLLKPKPHFTLIHFRLPHSTSPRRRQLHHPCRAGWHFSLPIAHVWPSFPLSLPSFLASRPTHPRPRRHPHPRRENPALEIKTLQLPGANKSPQSTALALFERLRSYLGPLSHSSVAVVPFFSRRLSAPSQSQPAIAGRYTGCRPRNGKPVASPPISRRRPSSTFQILPRHALRRRSARCVLDALKNCPSGRDSSR
jgi:hypothetical protein